jgi:hypothetical protein
MSRNSRINLYANLRREAEEEMRREIAEQYQDQETTMDSPAETELESSTETEIDSPDVSSPMRRRFAYINPAILSQAQEMSGVAEMQISEEQENFEEDQDKYNVIETGIDSIGIDNSYISDEDVDDTCKPQESGKISYKRKIMMKNCRSCYDFVTMENFKDSDNIVSIKIYDPKKGKLNKGQCVSIDNIKESIKGDIGNQSPTHFYSLYTKRPGAKDTRGGHGTYPDNRFVVKIELPGAMYITLSSLYKLLKGYEMIDEFYAIPLFGGKRRRIGNLEGAFYQSSNHGQIPGFVIYKLYTKRELKEGVNADITRDDFVFPIYIARQMSEMLELFRDTSQIRTIVLDSIIEYLLQDADSEQEIYF